MTDDDRTSGDDNRTLTVEWQGRTVKGAPFTEDHVVLISTLSGNQGTDSFRVLVRLIQYSVGDAEWRKLSDEWMDPTNKIVTAPTLLELFELLSTAWFAQIKGQADGGAKVSCPFHDCGLECADSAALADHLQRQHA